MIRKCEPWTASEIAQLRELWPRDDLTMDVISQLVKRTLRATVGKAYKLGLRHPRSNSWSPAEVAQLRELWPRVDLTVSAIAHLLAGKYERTAMAIQAKAQDLQLAYRRSAATTRTRFTANDWAGFLAAWHRDRVLISRYIESGDVRKGPRWLRGIPDHALRPDRPPMDPDLLNRQKKEATA